MIDGRLLRVLGIGSLAAPLQVLLLTAVIGIAVKTGSLALWRKTDKLASAATYLKTGLLLAAASIVVVVTARQGMLEGGISTQTVYALVLAKLADQTYVLLSGG